MTRSGGEPNWRWPLRSMSAMLMTLLLLLLLYDADADDLVAGANQAHDVCAVADHAEDRVKVVEVAAGPSVMKNWLPFVFGPAFAIERTPAPV